MAMGSVAPALTLMPSQLGAPEFNVKPAPTQVLIDLSEIVQNYLIYILVVAGAAVWGWFYFLKTKQGRDFWDKNRIRLPIFGAIAHKICLARFTRTLASLVRSGVPILEVLQIVSQTAWTPFIRPLVMRQFPVVSVCCFAATQGSGGRRA